MPLNFKVFLVIECTCIATKYLAISLEFHYSFKHSLILKQILIYNHIFKITAFKGSADLEKQADANLDFSCKRWASLHLRILSQPLLVVLRCERWPIWPTKGGWGWAKLTGNVGSFIQLQLPIGYTDHFDKWFELPRFTLEDTFGQMFSWLP